jgi:hypothetical protein
MAEKNKAPAGGGDPADAFYDAWQREEEAATETPAREEVSRVLDKTTREEFHRFVGF